jgi:hypothetical protein
MKAVPEPSAAGSIAVSAVRRRRVGLTRLL